MYIIRNSGRQTLTNADRLQELEEIVESLKKTITDLKSTYKVKGGGYRKKKSGRRKSTRRKSTRRKSSRRKSTRRKSNRRKSTKRRRR